MRQITNYELGILIPLHSQEEVDRLACWERPPQKYVLGRDEPWVRLSLNLCLPPRHLPISMVADGPSAPASSHPQW